MNQYPCGHCGLPRSGTRVRCACIPPRVWESPEARAAIARRDLGALLRVLREKTTLSQIALAQMTGASQATISKLLNGQAGFRRSERIALALEGLGAPTVQATEANPPGPVPVAAASFPPTLPEFLRQVVALWASDLQAHTPPESGPSLDHLKSVALAWLAARPEPLLPRNHGSNNQVSDTDIAAIDRTCVLFTELDDEFGGAHARTSAVQYLHSEIGPLLQSDYTTERGKRLFGAVARFTAQTGAMAEDAGIHHLARQYFLQSLTFAHLGSDRLMAAHALILLSHHANLLGQFGHALDLARIATVGAVDEATPAARAMLAAGRARALASLGDEPACARALHEMEEALQHTGHRGDPEWMAYFDASEADLQIAHCCHDLGQGRRAIEHARRFLATAPRSRRRNRTIAGLLHASAHLRTAEAAPEAASALARTTIQRAGHLRSARVRVRLTRLRADLQPYAANRSVEELENFLAEAPLARDIRGRINSRPDERNRPNRAGNIPSKATAR